MKKILKYLFYVLVGLVVIVAGLLTYVKVALPNVGPAENLTVERTPERIARGKYLANNIMVCMDCHSTRDWSKFSGPLTPGTLGRGGEKFDQAVGMPGVIYSRNITPAGITRYTDGELFRVITTGVTKEGRPLFPLMPYPYYSRMDKEDIYSVIAYIRSLPSIDHAVPDTRLDFPMNFIVHLIPQKATLGTLPDTTDLLAYGAYITNACGCKECHTPVNNGQIIEDLAFGGGREFKLLDGSTVRSMNLTPDATGLGAWTEDLFVNRFRMYADSSYVDPTVEPGSFNTMMPWTMYGHMKVSDLRAIYTYLKTVKPIKNTMNRFTPRG